MELPISLLSNPVTIANHYMYRDFTREGPYFYFNGSILNTFCSVIALNVASEKHLQTL